MVRQVKQDRAANRRWEALPASHAPRRDSAVRLRRLSLLDARGQEVTLSDELARSAGYNARQLAAQLGVSPRQLQRMFRAHCDLTPRAWLDACRLRQAWEMLQHSRSVKEVAFMLGFARHSHFSRKFRDYFGCTPSSVADGALAAGYPAQLPGTTFTSNEWSEEMAASDTSGAGRNPRRWSAGDEESVDGGTTP